MIDLGGDPPVPGNWYLEADSGSLKYCHSVKGKTINFSDGPDSPVTLETNALGFAIFFTKLPQVDPLADLKTLDDWADTSNRSVKWRKHTTRRSGDTYTVYLTDTTAHSRDNVSRKFTSKLSYVEARYKAAEAVRKGEV